VKPDIKQAWLTALRSGDYRQGQSYLRQGEQYCCLGVLCDLYSKAVGPEWREPREDDPDQVRSMLDEDIALPFEVQEWAGLELEGDNPVSLATHNDTGATFEELADIIEAKL
jgi:hypothetical protein